MPVNYKPVPDVPPQLAPTPSIREDVPHVRFSGAVGEALEYVGRAGYGALGKATEDVGRAFDSLGKNFEGAGKEIFDRAVALKALESDKKVDDLVIAYNQKQSELGEKFRTQMGDKAGPDALTAHLKQGADLRVGMRNGLTQYEQRKFDSETRGIYQSDSRLSVGHSSAQVRHSLTATNEAKISMEIDRMGKSQTNEELKERYDNIERLTRQGGDLAGKNSEQLEHDLSVNLTKGMVSYINTMAEGDPRGAMQLLEANKENIMNPFYENAKRDIQEKIDRNDARGAADRATKDPDIPLEEQEKKAKDEIEKIGGSREAEDRAVDNVRKAFNIKKQTDRDQFYRDRDTINDFLAGHLNPDGKLPTKEEEVDISPKSKAAWSRMTPTQRKPFLKALTQNSKEDYAQTPATVTRFDQLMGMSFNPEKKDEFRNMDIMSEKIPMTFKKELLARMREIVAKGQDAMDNPKVERVIGVLKADGVLSKEFQQDSSTMDVFRGKVHKAIMKFEADKRGPSTDEEKLKIGRVLLKEVEGTGWFGSNFGAQKVFEKMGVNAVKDIPISWAEQYRGSGLYKDDETMLADYANWYFIKQYDKLFGGRPVSKGTVESK